MRLQIGIRIAAVIEQGLPLPNHAKATVVYQRNLDWYVVDGAGGELLIGHLEATITVNRPNRFIWAADFRTHSSWNSKAHGAETTRIQPSIGVLIADELRGPHLMLPHPGCVN